MKNGSFLRLRSSGLFGSSEVKGIPHEVNNVEGILGAIRKNFCPSTKCCQGNGKRWAIGNHPMHLLAIRLAGRNCRGLSIFSGKRWFIFYFLIFFFFLFFCIWAVLFYLDLKSKIIWCINQLAMRAARGSWPLRSGTSRKEFWSSWPAFGGSMFPRVWWLGRDTYDERYCKKPTSPWRSPACYLI